MTITTAFVAAAIAASAMVYAVPLPALSLPESGDRLVPGQPAYGHELKHGGRDVTLPMKPLSPQQAELNKRWGPNFLHYFTDGITRCFVCKPKVKVDKFQPVDFTVGFHPKAHPSIIRIELNQKLPRLFEPTRRLAKKTQDIEDIPYLFLYHNRGPVLGRVALEPVTTQINQKKALLAMGAGRKSPLGTPQTPFV